MTPEEARKFTVELRKLAGGTIFSIVFIKRTTGELRRMHCRFGVSSKVKGVGANYSAAEKGLIRVYDVGKKGYRTVPIDGIVSFRVRGRSYNRKVTK